MAQSVAREAVFIDDHRATANWLAGTDWLAKSFLGTKKRQRILQAHIFELRCEMGNGIVPTDLAVSNNFESRSHLVRYGLPGHGILRVQQVGAGALATAERHGGTFEQLRFGAITLVWVTAGAGETYVGGTRSHQTSDE